MRIKLRMVSNNLNLRFLSCDMYFISPLENRHVGVPVHLKINLISLNWESHWTEGCLQGLREMSTNYL